MISRRDFVAGSTALAATGAAFPAFDLGFIAPARAQQANLAEIAKAGPLGDEVVGRQDAPVTIIEYASMTCGHCAAFHNTTYPELKKRYIDTGKVRFVLREFPLDPLAAAGFMLARCAGKDKYYPMIEILFEKQKEWAVQQPLPPLTAIAKQAGFTQERFEQCLSDQKILEGIETTRAHAAEKLGVNSTPTFFVNGKIIRGAVSIDELAKEIEPFLKS